MSQLLLRLLASPGGLETAGGVLNPDPGFTAQFAVPQFPQVHDESKNSGTLLRDTQRRNLQTAHTVLIHSECFRNGGSV